MNICDCGRRIFDKGGEPRARHFSIVSYDDMKTPFGKGAADKAITRPIAIAP